MGRLSECHVTVSIQCVREMLSGGAGSVECLRFLPRALRIGQGLCPHFGSHEMIGQVFQMRIECGAIHLLHGFGKRPMQCLALSLEQLLVDGMASENVAKGKLLSSLFD